MPYNRHTVIDMGSRSGVMRITFSLSRVAREGERDTAGMDASCGAIRTNE
jgi:hypothetical protein